MARNHKFYFDRDGTPRARGPTAERVLMSFLETDVQGSDHVCRDLMDDLEAVEDGTDDVREFTGNAHTVTLRKEGVTIAATPSGQRAGTDAGTDVGTDAGTDAGDAANAGTGGGSAPGSDPDGIYRAAPKHFREVLEDWEAFILDDLPDAVVDDDLPA